jgi:hypothetical protein
MRMKSRTLPVSAAGMGYSFILPGTRPREA